MVHLSIALRNKLVSQVNYDHRSCERNFSNSLIIHEKEKTKEITTVKEVWICDPNRPFYSCVLSCLAFE